MKIFWAILATLLLACGAYFVFVRGGSAKPLVNAKPAPEIAPSMNYGVPKDESVFFGDDGFTTPPEAAKTAGPVTPAETNKTVNGDSVKPDASAPKKSDEPVATDKNPETVTKPVEEKTPTATKPDEKKTANAAQAATPEATPSTNTPGKPPADGSANAANGASTTPATAAAEGTAESKGDAGAEYTAVKQDDGSMLIDNKYTVRGDGTKENPYQITWEYLTSTEEVYQPRLGKKKLPGRLSMLNDHYVKISGYIAFPIMATEPTEMLTMLNQWDGCCIGVPPSPYDAIEVKLKKAAEGEERLASYGAVSGKLKVEPYLVKDWLVSLFMMEEGEITKK